MRKSLWPGGPIFLLVSVILVTVGSVFAHHGWSGYDSSKALELKGTIVESGYEHPHGFVRLKAAEKTWFVALAPRSRSRILPVTALAAHLLPWARASLLFIVPSGLMMFAAHATEFATNPAFQLKLALLAAAAANAIAFHLRTFRTVTAWDRGAPARPAAKVAAILSLSLWSGVIVCGRLLAYL